MFNCLQAERRRNDCLEAKWSCGLHIQLCTLYKRVALENSLFLSFTGGKRCTAGTGYNKFSTWSEWGRVARWKRSGYAKLRLGNKPSTICRMLPEEGLIANQMGIHRFLQKHRETNNIERRPGSGRPAEMTVAVEVEWQMRDNDETTAVQLHTLLLPNRPWSFIQRQIILRSFY